MRRRRSSALVLVAGAGVAVLVAVPLVLRSEEASRSSGTPTPSGTTAGRMPDGPGLSRLVLACRASSTLPYSGVQRVRVASGSGDRTTMVDVAHVPGSGVRLTVHAGRDRGADTFVGRSDGPSLLPVIDEATLARIASRYTVRGPQPGPRIAGRDTDVVELVRASGTSTGSVAARFWLDRQTSFPLQREVVDGAGHVQQASSYTSISFRRPAVVPRLTAVAGSATDLGQGVTDAQLGGLRRDGWQVPGTLPDGFDLVDARVHSQPASTGNAPLVLQLGYTDGISVVSVFEQRGRLDAASLSGWGEQRRGGGQVYVDSGTPQRMVWSAGDSVYTAVGDDPAAVDAVLTAVPPRSSRPGVAHRLRHGVERLASWADPFG